MEMVTCNNQNGGFLKVAKINNNSCRRYRWMAKGLVLKQTLAPGGDSAVWSREVDYYEYLH